MSKKKNVYELLELKYKQYADSGFVDNDPICIPHRYNKKQDIEIAGLLAAILSWGKREIIIRNSLKLMQLMDDSPYDFIVNAKAHEFKRFQNFKHRTFQPEDALFILKALQKHYRQNDSLEELFIHTEEKKLNDIGISHFRNSLLGQNPECRTKKHLPNPLKNSASKRICMYLRWMVRKNKEGIDFGIWHKIKPADLFLPLDVHTARSARSLGLLKRDADDWKSVLELTDELKKMDANDPVKYDFALFGLSLNNEIT